MNRPVIWRNSQNASVDHTPLVSICIPVFNFNVLDLVRVISDQASPYGFDVEIVIADDASTNPEIIELLQALAATTNTATRLCLFRQNQGRARIRKYLTEQAAGRYTLFLDCDMYPDDDQFVARYLSLARVGRHDIVVGGCSYKRLGTVQRSCRLYHVYSSRTQCVPLIMRTRDPLRYTFTNNIMIRRDLLARIPFDMEYVGWGYEDTDLAFAVASIGGSILHIENTATHLGLIDDKALLRKYKQSVPNFLRLRQKFPAEANALPISRAANRLSVLPLPYGRLSKALEALVSSAPVPLKLQYLLFQGYRLALYSQAVRAQGLMRPASV